MSPSPTLTFRVADTAADFEQIFQLNHATFVDEIPQHRPHADGRLVDRFHAENTYLVALQGEQLIGMLALRDRRPFSLDEKLGPIDAWLPPGCRPCEVRLLAVEPHRRGGLVLRGLLRLLLRRALERGYDVGVISGAVRQLGLYRHLGFRPFGPLVGSEPARFQPMLVTIDELQRRVGAALGRGARPRPVPAAARSFLPGPVAIAAEVQRAFAAAPISHRSPAFAQQRGAVSARLCRLTGATHAAVMVGSGTLANDVVAAQLSLRDQPGVILRNGEFSGRLVDHAGRAGLRCTTIDGEWGQRFDAAAVRRALASTPAPRWLWATLCETSTGCLEDVAMLRRLCREHGVELCLDAVSAIGAVPVDLDGVHLATAVSGKALGSYPGLAIVLHSHAVAPSPRLPRYLDLGLHHALDGVPFTHSSNLLAALHTTLQRFSTDAPFVRARALSVWLRAQLRALGLCIVADDAIANPVVTTLARPPGGATALGDRLAARGFLVGYQSGYLRARDWLQICLMGDHDHAGVRALVAVLRDLLGRDESAATLESS